MSKDVIVLTPNGRRQKVHCKPDTNILEILENVCEKQGFQPTDYDLKHHNNVLDLSTTIRFSNLPNKATLEMVEADRKREETSVTVGLQLEDGERRTADFTPNTSLYQLIMELAPGEINNFPQPTILYMRQEVIGLNALKDKTLRKLGLIQGRAVLRLLNKAEETKQANISAVYRVPIKEPDHPHFEKHCSNVVATSSTFEEKPSATHYTPAVEKGKDFDPVKFLKTELHSRNINEVTKNTIEEEPVANFGVKIEELEEEPMQVDQNLPSTTVQNSTKSAFQAQQALERRLQIEDEVTFLNKQQKAIAFMQPDVVEEEFEDLPDDFYELTIEEVRKLYYELQQQTLEYENTPLLTSSKREQLRVESSEQRVSEYKNAVVRIQFPDRMILQGVFQPTSTIEDISKFVKEHLATPKRPFHLLTTPLRETLDYKMTLAEAGFVPGVHMHFRWSDDKPDQVYLKKEIYKKTTSSDAAGLLASKYRAPTRRKQETASSSHNSGGGPSTSKASKLPKWFRT